MAKTLADYERDYHAADRDAVLADIRSRGQQAINEIEGTPEMKAANQQAPSAPTPPQQPGSPQPAGNKGVDYSGWTTPGTSIAQVQPPQPQQTAQTQAQPSTNFDRNVFRDMWMGTGNNVAAQDALLKQFGIQLDPAGRGRLPSGELLDLRIGAKAGQNLAGWTAIHDPLNPGAYPGGGAAGGVGSAAGGVGGSNVGGGGGGALNDSLIATLLERSRQSLNPNAATDPTIRAQADPFAAAVERQRRDDLSAVAERQGPGANIRGEERLGRERAGQQTGQFESQLIGQEIDARRQEIQAALSGLLGVVSQDKAQALQRELAMLNDATQRLGIQTGAQTAARGQDLGWQQALLGNEQFMADLGLRAEDRFNYWDALNRGAI